MTDDGGTVVFLAGAVESDGRVRAVDGVDLQIAAGEVVALLGPNGASTSSTIDLMLGLTAPDPGTARLFGLTPTEAVRRGRADARRA